MKGLVPIVFIVALVYFFYPVREQLTTIVGNREEKTTFSKIETQPEIIYDRPKYEAPQPNEGNGIEDEEEIKKVKPVKNMKNTGKLSLEQAKANYIREWAPVAVESMYNYGIPASISLGQGLIESLAGTSKLARTTNNHFGLKCFSRQCSEGHCTRHTDDSHKDFFRTFRNARASWECHSQWITTGSYKKLVDLGTTDYKGWARGLKQIGYATSPTYANDLIRVIEENNLNRFDRATKKALIEPAYTTVPKPIKQKKGSWTPTPVSKSVKSNQTPSRFGPVKGEPLYGN